MVRRPPPPPRPERQGGERIFIVILFIDENLAPLKHTCGEALQRSFRASCHANGIGRFLLCLPFTLPVFLLDSSAAAVFGFLFCFKDSMFGGRRPVCRYCPYCPAACEFIEAGRGFDGDDPTNANLGFCSLVIYFICPILDPITTFCLRGTRVFYVYGS
jgi:hypothetical protein